MQQVYGIEKSRVALLNVGKEAEKGDEIRQKAYILLQETSEINFVGNMESRDLLSGNYDVVVCDGFSGNVLVKTTEGTALELLKKLKKDIYSRTLYKMGAFLMRKMFADEKEFMNYQNYGGGVLLGTLQQGHGCGEMCRTGLQDGSQLAFSEDGRDYYEIRTLRILICTNK